MAKPPAKPELGAESSEDEPMTVFEHLGELRTRLVRSVLGIIPCIALAWELREQLLSFLVAPLSQAWLKLHLGEPTLHFSNPVDLFVAYVKIAMIVGLIFASPWIAYQMWGFVAPGLYSREKLYAIPFAMASAVFFAGGAFFGYSTVFPFGFQSLLGMAGMLPSHIIRVQPTIMIDEYLGFATGMLLAFGVVFEVPVVLTFMAFAGVVNWKQLLKFSRYWILIASILAAVLTPSPDVGSMLMMMGPLILLYYLSVAIAYFIGPKVEAEIDEPDPDAKSTKSDSAPASRPK
jgi:sec-independent protein translocase protein TatC